MSAFVYLLHFDQPYPGGQLPRHYLGVARDVESRMTEHRNGSSKSRLTRACRERGIEVELVRQWSLPYPKAAFDFERRLKQQKHSYSRLCPLCKDAKNPLAKLVPERVYTAAQCSCRVAYLPSGRQCRKRATWLVGGKLVCGSHALSTVFMSRAK